jgi:hypothetical protein
MPVLPYSRHAHRPSLRGWRRAARPRWAGPLFGYCRDCESASDWVSNQFKTADVTAINYVGARRLHAGVVVNEGLARRAFPRPRSGWHLEKALYASSGAIVQFVRFLDRAFRTFWARGTWPPEHAAPKSVPCVFEVASQCSGIRVSVCEYRVCSVRSNAKLRRGQHIHLAQYWLNWVFPTAASVAVCTPEAVRLPSLCYAEPV